VIRVLLVEGAGLLRGALAALLERETDIHVVAAEVGDGQAVDLALSCRPDVVVIDVDHPDAEELVLRGSLCEKLPHARMMLVTGELPPERLRRVLTRRMPGVVGKNAPAGLLLEGIRKLVAGERFIDPELAVRAFDALDNPLTPREQEVLRIAAEGAPTSEMADRLALSVGTVRNHLSAIAAKTGARNRVDAIRIAREAGWL
jgi:two-component system response regulator DesR